MRAGDALRAMQALPVARLDTILAGRRALILAPYSDDESLGRGGLIAEACRLGQTPAVTIVIDGTGSYPSLPSYPVRARHALAGEYESGLGNLRRTERGRYAARRSCATRKRPATKAASVRQALPAGFSPLTW